MPKVGTGLRDAALAYLAQGYSVIPITAGAKAPPLLAWEPYQKARAHADFVREWWTEDPDANIAIITGKISGITVIDVDGEAGIRSARETLFNGEVPTKIHRTPRGYHLIFQYDDRFQTGAGFLDGIDVRNDGGYIIAPPSVVDGKPYSVFRSRQPAAIPFDPALLLRKPKATAAVPTNGTHPTWVSDALGGVPEAQRNQTAARLAGYFHHKGVPTDIIRATLTPYAEGCDPPMDPRELDRTIASVVRYQQQAADNAIVEPPEFQAAGDRLTYSWPTSGITIDLEDVHADREGVYCDLTIRGETPGRPQVQHGPVRYNLKATRSQAELVRHLGGRLELDWSTAIEQMSRLAIAHHREAEPTLDLRDIARPDFARYLMEPFVLEGQPTILFGDGGTGKSLLALAIQAAIETGNADILGIAPSRRTRGYLLDWEFDGYEHAQRLDKILAGVMAGRPDHPLAYRRCHLPLHQEIAAIHRYVEENSIGFVIVDSAAAACGEEPEKASEAIRFFNALRRLNVATLIVAHQTKRNKDSDPDKPFGSVFWHNCARSTWQVGATQDGHALNIGLYNKKSNVDLQRPPIGYRIAFGTTDITLTPTSVFETPELAEKTSLKARMIHALKERSMTTAELSEAVGASEGTIRTYLKRHDRLFDRIGEGIRLR